MFTPCIVGTTATFYFPYFTNKKAKRVIPVPLLLGNSSCSWHHVPPRYFRYGASASPYAGRRTVCFVRDPVSRWLSEAFYRKVAFSAKSLNSYTAQLVGRLRNGTRSTFRPAAFVDSPEKLKEMKKRPLDAATIDWDPLQDCHLIPQHVYVFDETGARVCDEILRTTNLTAEIQRLKAEDCKTGIETRTMNARPKAHDFTWRDLEPELLRAITRLYARDYELLGDYFDDRPDVSSF